MLYIYHTINFQGVSSDNLSKVLCQAFPPTPPSLDFQMMVWRNTKHLNTNIDRVLKRGFPKTVQSFGKIAK